MLGCLKTVFKLENFCYDEVRLDYACGSAAADGPISHPQDNTWVNMEQQLNDIDRAKPKDSGRNLSQWHSVQHKSHMDCSESENPAYSDMNLRQHRHSVPKFV
jgi:hypothetical protein